MVNTFFIGDLHAGHKGVISEKFTRPDGSRLRNFDTIKEHDEHLVKRINSVVRPQDRLIISGDVSMGKNEIALIGRLNGKKQLVGGNHDRFPSSEYLKYFENIYGCLVIGGMIVTHIPIHTDCIGRWKANIHGHLHANIIDDPRYINVSCEQVNYTPISLEEIKKRLK